jgi:PhnB protein
MSVKAIPDNYGAVAPYLIVKDAPRAIEFYKSVFGATERGRLADPTGRIAHAELEIGGSVLMLTDEIPEYGAFGPQPGRPVSVRLHIYVQDVDSVVNKAVAAGSKLLIPVADQFYGDRSGRIADPFGHVWLVSTHKEDVSHAEMQKRFDEFSRQHSKK